MTIDEREELDALLKTPGWAVFVAHCQQEWGTEEGGGAKFMLGVRQASNDTADADAMAKMRQIVVAQREIQALLRWPRERIEKLTTSLVEPNPRELALTSLSRRGPL